MSDGQVSVLARRSGLIFVSKPAGIPTEPDAKHADSVLARVAELVHLPREQLHAHSRLDIPVSGVVTLSATREARLEIVGLRERGLWRRRYIGLAAGDAAPSEGTWREPIGRGRGQRRSTKGMRAEPAETYFKIVARAAFPVEQSAVALLALEPRTGRTHQLRVHAAVHGLPLLGDRAYGGPQRFTSPNGVVHSIGRLALHSAWVELGEGASALRVASPLPVELVELWQALAGDPEAWQLALADAAP